MKEHLKANFFFKQLIKRAFVSGVCACPSIKLQLPPSYLSTPHTLSMLFLNTTHSFLSLVFFSPLSFPNSTNHYINSSYFTTQHNTHKSSFKVFFFFFLIISHRIWNNEWSMAPSFDTSTHTVCVMDASGHLGFSLVQRLLQRGYTVHASVQSYGNLIIPINQLPL